MYFQDVVDPNLTKSAPFSPIMIDGMFVFDDAIVGMMDESMMRSLSTPWTRRSGATTDFVSAPIRQVPIGCQEVWPDSLIYDRISSSVITSGPGISSLTI